VVEVEQKRAEALEAVAAAWERAHKPGSSQRNSMDFLNDKKNQPIIIGVVVAILLAVGVFMYLQSRPPAPAADMTGQVAPAGGATTPPGVSPGAPGAATPAAPIQPGQVAPPQTAAATPAGTPAGAPAGSKAVAAKPVEKFRLDPFAMLNPPKKSRIAKVQVREAIPYPTWLIIPKQAPRVKQDNTGGEKVDTTPRRMAGVMFGNSVSAILETGDPATTVVVRPGDLIENSTMRVEKIEPTRIVLKSMDNPKKPRFVDVMMAAGLGNPAAAAAPAPATPTSPFARPGNAAPRPRYGVGAGT
jgi:hypothetical protein